LLTAIGLSPGGNSTVHIYTKTIHRTTQNKQYIEQQSNLGNCGPCPVLASYTLAFILQLRKKHGKTSVRVGKTSVRVGKTSVRVGKPSVRVEEPQGRKNLGQGRKNLSQGRKNVSQGRRTSG